MLLVGTIGLALVALPELPRVARFLLGRSTAGAAGSPPLLPWPRVRSVTRWVSPALGLLLVATGARAKFELAWVARPDGTVTLRGDGRGLVIASDPELRYLLDRDFSWAPRVPVDR